MSNFALALWDYYYRVLDCIGITDETVINNYLIGSSKTSKLFELRTAACLASMDC